MRIRERSVNNRYHDDMVLAGFTRTGQYFTVDDSDLMGVIDKAATFMSGAVLNIIAKEMGVQYIVPCWFPVRETLLALMKLWDGNPESLPLRYNIRTIPRPSFTRVSDIMSGDMTIVINSGGDPAYNRSWSAGVVNGWIILPNIIISPTHYTDTISCTGSIIEAVEKAVEAGRDIWGKELTDVGASELANRLASARQTAADVLRRLVDQSLSEYNAEYNAAQRSLKKYLSRRKEYKTLTTVALTTEHIKEHVNAMNSVPGVAGVLVCDEELCVKFDPFKVSIPVCDNHVFPPQATTRVQSICGETGLQCEGPRIDVCEDGHVMEMGKPCDVCNKPFRGVQVQCTTCGELYSSFGPEPTKMWVTCTYCDSQARVNTYNFPSFLGTIKLNRAEDHHVTLIGDSRPSNARDYQHPHINYDGVCCWGSSSGVPAYYLREGLYLELITLMVSLLRSYVPNDAYVKITPWKI